MSKTFSADKLYFDELVEEISTGITYDSNHNWDADFGTGIHAVGNLEVEEVYSANEILTISIQTNLDTIESYANFIDLMPLIPEKFRNSTVLQQFTDVANLNVGKWLGYTHDTQYLLDPYNVGEDYLQYLADLIGLEFVINTSTTSEDKRGQLEQAIDWYKSKGTYQALLRIGYVLGVALDAYDLYTEDYITFVREPWFAGREGINPPDLATGTAWSQYDKMVLHLNNNYLDATGTKAPGNINVSFSNTIYKFGDYSCYFNGTNAYISTAAIDSSWDINNNKFTLDCQVYLLSLPLNQSMVFIARWKPITGGRSFWFGYNNTTQQLQFFWSLDGTSVKFLSADWTPKLNTWYHVQVARDGSDIAMAVEGKRLSIDLETSDTILSTDSIYAPSTNKILTLGASLTAGGTPANFFNGYMDEVRIQNGAAARMFDFDPPTKPYSASTRYYKSPHLGIDIILNKVYGTDPDTYLFKAQTYIDLLTYVEKIRPVNVVAHYYLDLYPIVDETGTVTVVGGNIKTIAFAPWAYTKTNFDGVDSEASNFNDGTHFFDYTDDLFLQTFNKWQLGTGNKNISPDTSGFSLENVVLSGNVDKIDVYSDRAEFEILVPSNVTQTGISELGIFLSNNTTLKIASTFPDIDIVSGVGLRILVKLYYNRS